MRSDPSLACFHPIFSVAEVEQVRAQHEPEPHIPYTAEQIRASMGHLVEMGIFSLRIDADGQPLYRYNSSLST